MPSSTLRIGRPAESAEDAERPRRHSHAERGNEGKSFLGRWSRRKLGGDRREASKDRSTRLSQLFYEVWMNLSDRALTSNEIPGRSPGPRASRPAGPHLPSLRGPARA